MFEDVAERLESLWLYFLGALEAIYHGISSINPTQLAVLWIQIIAGSLTVVWIIFQFAWMRRLNEARLERYLEDRIATERDELAKERSETLAMLDRVARRRGIRRALLLIWANFRLAVSFVLRMLSLGTIRGLTDHTLLLTQVGMLNRARRIYSDVAHDAIKKMRLYEDALANKRVEAQNALIFAGRMAVLEGRPEAAVSSFKKATRLRDDPDARLLIGKQLAATSDVQGALHEYRIALSHPSIDAKPGTKAELHRSIAKILMKQGSPGRARQELTNAQTLDEPLRDYLGLGKTHELLGDLYAPRPRNRPAAMQAYTAAIENFEHARDVRRVRMAKRKLRNLTGEPQPPPDDWWTRALDHCARTLLRTIERRRAQQRKTED